MGTVFACSTSDLSNRSELSVLEAAEIEHECRSRGGCIHGRYEYLLNADEKEQRLVIVRHQRMQ